MELPRALRLSLTIPGVFVACTLLTLTFPVVALLALAVDALRARRGAGLASLRVVLFGLAFLWIEVVALLRLGALGLGTLGGPQALLDAAPDCDLLLVGHEGLEGFAEVADIWAGALRDRVVRLRFWHYGRTEVPGEPEARREWLGERWQQLDDWLATLASPAP